MCADIIGLTHARNLELNAACVCVCVTVYSQISLLNGDRHGSDSSAQQQQQQQQSVRLIGRCSTARVEHEKAAACPSERVSVPANEQIVDGNDNDNDAALHTGERLYALSMSLSRSVYTLPPVVQPVGRNVLNIHTL